MQLIFISISWILGIAIGSYTNVSLMILSVSVLPLIALPFLHNRRAILILASVCILSLTGGMIRTQADAARIDGESLQLFNDSSAVLIEGIIDSDPDRRDSGTSFQVSVSSITIDNSTAVVNGRAMVNTGRYPHYRYGDRISMSGIPRTPVNRTEFDYKEYLEEKGIRTAISYPKIKLVERDQGNPILTAIYTLRRNMSQSLSKALPEPQNSLAQGILLGLRSSIPQQLKNAFSSTGTTHILAISGHNLSIFIGICLAIGIWIFGRKHRIYIWLALGITWAYTLLSGMSPPVIRSALMISLFLAAELLGRQRHSMNALLFAAAVMTAFNPHVLRDVSFQLSFMAMSGLIVLSPGLISRGRDSINRLVRSRGFARSTMYLCTDSIAVTIAALLATCPLIAYYFNTFSLVGIPTTFFASLALPGIIISSALTGLSGLFLPAASTAFGWITWLILSYFILIIQAFNALPFASVTYSLQAWHVWTYYAAAVVVIPLFGCGGQSMPLIRQIAHDATHGISLLTKAINEVPKKWLLYPVSGALILIWSAILTTPDGRLHVSFLDIGQGDAILIQFPGRQTILIDAGPSPQKIKEELGEKLPFWNRDIDILFLTQPHADHIAGAIDLLKDYNIKEVIEAGTVSESSIYMELRKTIEERKIPHRIIAGGNEIDFGSGVVMEILHPPYMPFDEANVDNNGLVMRLHWNDISFLFTADIGEEAEQYMVNRRTYVQSTVMKAAHHGSNTSSSEEFLSAVYPSVAVISTGAGNKFGHPSQDVVKRLCRITGEENIFSTAENGTVELITDGTRLWVRTDKHGIKSQ